MKFRAIREFQGGNLRKNRDTEELEWHGKQIFRARQLISTSREEVEKQISLGRHSVTNRPMGSLLNHCKPHDKEAEELTEDFYSDVEKKEQKGPEKPEANVRMNGTTLIARITAAKTSEQLSGLLTPGESRVTVMRAFNRRSEEIAAEDEANNEENI